ncbi:MAG: hypothetical protein HY319_04435 [Armatimonadetes bacterium]|nr:hypothetical protein [Armatimonadota bacterium]
MPWQQFAVLEVAAERGALVGQDVPVVQGVPVVHGGQEAQDEGEAEQADAAPPVGELEAPTARHPTQHNAATASPAPARVEAVGEDPAGAPPAEEPTVGTIRTAKRLAAATTSVM